MQIDQDDERDEESVDNRPKEAVYTLGMQERKDFHKIDPYTPGPGTHEIKPLVMKF